MTPAKRSSPALLLLGMLLATAGCKDSASNVPSAPLALRAIGEPGAIQLAWSEPERDGGSPITGYRVECEPREQGSTLDVEGLTARVSGLKAGASYRCLVGARNALGLGPVASVGPVRIPGAPSAPTSVSARADIRAASVSWRAPTDTGGLPLTGFRVTASPGDLSQQLAPTATDATFTDLENGTTYTFTVAALNAEGAGPDASAEARTRPLPDAPSDFTVTPGPRSLTVTWRPPTSDAVEPTTSYTVEARPSGLRREVGPDVREVTFESLPSTRPQALAVTARNAVGEGPAAFTRQPAHPLPGPLELTSLEVVMEDSGCGTVRYGLRQQDGHRADVLVELDAEGDGTFTRATQAGSRTHSGLVAVATSPEGTSHAFSWNRSEDRPGAAPAARLRVTATVPGAAPVTRTVPVPLEPMTRRCEWNHSALGALSYDSSDDLVHGDFDRDGKPDVVADAYSFSDTSTHHVRFFPGRGNSSFELTSSNALRNRGSVRGPRGMASADVDGDGALDLLFLAFFSDSFPTASTTLQVLVARGLGDGGFEAPVATVLAQQAARDTSPYDARPPLPSDLDGDGIPEVVVAQAGTLYVLRYTDGALAVAFTHPIEPRGPVVTGDFDEDGHEDVLVVGESLQAFRGQGLLTFTPEPLGPTGGRVHSAVSADFDGDGHLDLAATLTVDAQTVLHLRPGDGEGHFGAPVRVDVQPNPYDPRLAVVDLDQDGIRDLALRTPRGEVITLLRERSAGTFEPRVLRDSGGAIVGAADFDGSGEPDLLLRAGGSLRVLRDPLLPRPRPVGSSTVFEDFNGDGWQDVASLADDAHAQVHFTRAEGGLQPSELSPVPPGTRRLRTARFDLGPTPDLLVLTTPADGAPGSISLLRGHGDGTFTPAEALPVGGPAWDYAVGDVDGDGDLDVACAVRWPVSSSYTGELRLLHNAGDGAFGPAVVFEDRRVIKTMDMGDLDRDGRAELVALRTGQRQPPGPLAPHSPSLAASWLISPYFVLDRYEARADGTLVLAASPEYDGCSASWMSLEELTGDGYLDVKVSCAYWAGSPTNIIPSHTRVIRNFGAPGP